MAKENQKLGESSDNDYFCLQEDEIYLLSFGRDELNSKEYLKWMNDLEITKTLGRFDYLMPVDRAKLNEYYESLDREKTIFLAIYLKTNGFVGEIKKADMKFIGTVKVYDIDLLAKRASLGIAVGDRSEMGKGYASKAIRIASRYIFDTLGLRKITAGYISGNKGVERAFLKNDFQVEAVFKEHIFYEGLYVDHKFVCKFRN